MKVSLRSYLRTLTKSRIRTVTEQMQKSAICSFDVVVERFVHAWNDAQKVRFIYIF